MSQVWDDMAREMGGLHDPPGSLPDRVHERLRGKILSWASGLPQGASFLDLGCGTGKLARALAQRRPDLRIQGMDISQAMLDIARAQAPDLLWIQGDARHWPLPDKSVDAVLALDLAAHLAPGPQIQALLSEARRVSRRWLLLELKNPWSLRALLAARRVLDSLAPRRAREFALGLKALSQRVPIHVQGPRAVLAGFSCVARLAPWPWLPCPSQVYVLDLNAAIREDPHES